MKRAEFNTRCGGYYFGCNFLLKALNVKTVRVINSSSRIARNIFRDPARTRVRMSAEGCAFVGAFASVLSRPAISQPNRAFRYRRFMTANL